MDSIVVDLIVLGVVAGVLAASIIVPKVRKAPKEDVSPIFVARGLGSIAPLGALSIGTNVSSYTLAFYEKVVVFSSITRMSLSYDEIEWVRRGILNTVWICLSNRRRLILFLPSDVVQIMNVFREKGVLIIGRDQKGKGP